MIVLLLWWTMRRTQIYALVMASAVLGCGGGDREDADGSRPPRECQVRSLRVDSFFTLPYPGDQNVPTLDSLGSAEGASVRPVDDGLILTGCWGAPPCDEDVAIATTVAKTDFEGNAVWEYRATMDSAPVSAQVRRAGVQGDAVFGVIGASTATTIPEGIALERGAHAVDFDASGGLALFPLDAFLGPDSDVVVRDYDRTPAGRALLIVLFETLVLEGETYTSTNGTANALLGLSTSDGSWALAIEPPVGGNAVLVDAAPHVSGGGLLAVSFRGDLDFDGRIVPYSGDLSDEDARDGLVVRFSESGDVLWATHLPGRTPKHLIVNATGDAYVVAEDGTTDVAMHFDPDGGEVIWERSLGFSAKAVAHPDGVVIRGRDAAGMLGCDALSESLVLVDNRGEVVFAATSPSEVDFEPFTLFRAMGDGRFVAMTTVNDGTVIDGTTVTAEGRDIAVITYSYLE